MNRKFEKSGQVGESITWFFATIIIVVILTISILFSNLYLGNLKKINLSQPLGLTYDIPLAKTFYSYILTTDNTGQNIYSQLQKDKNLNDFDGNLALDLFNGQQKLKIYQGSDLVGTLLSVNTVWVGLINYTSNGPNDISNTYFGSQGVHTPAKTTLFSESIWLNEDKDLSVDLDVVNNQPSK